MSEQLIRSLNRTSTRAVIAAVIGLGLGASHIEASQLRREVPNAFSQLHFSLQEYQEAEILPPVTAVPNNQNINIRSAPSPNSEIVGTPASEGIDTFELFGYIAPEHTGDGRTWYYTRVNNQNAFVQESVVTLSNDQGTPSLPDLTEALRIASTINVLDSRGNVVEGTAGSNSMRLEVFNILMQQMQARGYPAEILNPGVLSVFDTGLSSRWTVLRQEQRAGNNETGSVYVVLVDGNSANTYFLPPTQTSVDLNSLGLQHDVDFRPSRTEGIVQINTTISVNVESLLEGISFEESLVIREERESTGFTIRPGEVDLSSLVESHPDAPNYSVLGAIGFGPNGQFVDNSVLEQISNTITPDMFDNPAPLILSGGTEINETQLGSAIGYIDFMGSPYAVVACVVYNESISEPDSVQNQYHSFLPLFCKAENNAVNVYVKQVFGTPYPGASDQQWFMAANITDEGYGLLRQSNSDNPLDFSDLTDMIFRISTNQGEALIMDRLESAEDGYNGSIVLMMLPLGRDNIDGIVATRALAEGTLMPGANEDGFIPRVHSDDNVILLGNLSQDYLNERGYIVTGQPY